MDSTWGQPADGEAVGLAGPNASGAGPGCRSLHSRNNSREDRFGVEARAGDRITPAASDMGDGSVCRPVSPMAFPEGSAGISACSVGPDRAPVPSRPISACRLPSPSASGPACPSSISDRDMSTAMSHRADRIEARSRASATRRATKAANVSSPARSSPARMASTAAGVGSTPRSRPGPVVASCCVSSTTRSRIPSTGNRRPARRISALSRALPFRRTAGPFSEPEKEDTEMSAIPATWPERCWTRDGSRELSSADRCLGRRQDACSRASSIVHAKRASGVSALARASDSRIATTSGGMGSTSKRCEASDAALPAETIRAASTDCTEPLSGDRQRRSGVAEDRALARARRTAARVCGEPVIASRSGSCDENATPSAAGRSAGTRRSGGTDAPSLSRAGRVPGMELRIALTIGARNCISASRRAA